MLESDSLMDGRAASESDAFMDAIDPLIPVAYRLAYGLVRSKAEVDDIVQEATLKAWKHRASLRPGSEMRPWFLAIVANQCRQAVRARWWSVIRHPDPASVDRHQAVDPGDEVESVRQGLRKLKHKDRLVLVLRYYLDESYDDIAATLHVSPQAARVRLHRALARLRPIVDVSQEPNDE